MVVKENLARWLRSFSIKNKLYCIIGAMGVLIAVELAALFFSLGILSAVRAYVGGEGLWSKAQKDAVFHLYRYGVTHDQQDYLLFKSFMAVPLGDGEARRQLSKPHPDIAAARHGFIQGRNNPDDIDGMIRLFRDFGHTFYLARANAIWTEGEQIALQLIPISESLHRELSSGPPSQAKIDPLLASISPINTKLTVLEDQFSYTLGEGSRWLESVVLRLLFLVALTVELTGLVLTISISRRVQNGLTDIIRAAKALATGNYRVRARLFSYDEIGILAASFNSMADRLESGINDLRWEIAERQRTEAELRKAFALLDRLLNNTPLAVIEWEQNYSASEPPRVRRWSGRAREIFGWTEGEVLGRRVDEFRLIHEGDAERASRPNNAVTVRCYTKDGQIRHCRWYNSALHSETGNTAILSLVEDTTQQVVALEDVYRLAHHDVLTGLPNRVLLHDRLMQTLAYAQRSGQAMSVMMLDLDNFKTINDTLGHTAGDELLREVGGRLGAKLRASDTLARIGGDEFVVIQTGHVDRASAGSSAQRLIDSLIEPFFISGNRVDVGVSIGVTMFPMDAEGPEELLRNADIALYRAKRDGRAHFCFYSAEMDLEMKHIRSLETGLCQALESGALQLFYQPTFSVADGRIQGLEALLRWAHPGGGFVAPAGFIPVAEMSGLIITLGEWALREACSQAKLWTATGGWDIRVAVNVSAVQLRQPDFAEMIEGILGEIGLSPSALELEITEGVFLDPSKGAITKALHQVAEMGVSLAIDDFGTGYSSLGYLRHFPFDRIKIDRSFVGAIGADTMADAIIQATIGLGHSLGKRVTAEGVETEFQLAFLRRHKCDEAQGYLLARPQPPSEMAGLAGAPLPATETVMLHSTSPND